MSKPLYVCTICSEDFTRKSDGDRHNHRFHPGKGQIIGSTEYIIGRINNTIAPPVELTPRLAAAKRRKKVSFYSKNDGGFTVYPDTMIGAPVLNNESYRHQSSMPSAEKIDSLTHFSNSQKTQDKSLLDESIDYAKKLKELQCLLRDLSSNRSTCSDNFIPPPSVSVTHPNHYLLPATGTPSYTSYLEKHMLNRKDIFGFSGQSCNQCISFEIVPHYFAAPDLDRFTRSTHKCKESPAKFSAGKQQDIDIHSLVLDNCACMVLLFYMLTRVWTDNKPYLRVVPLYDQLRGKHEALQIRYPSETDKLIRVPLKVDEAIELGAQTGDHWAFRVIKEGVTLIESHELMEFLIRIRISTYGIFRVKSLSDNQPRGLSQDLYFIYLSRY
jgi:hypothetical protein